MLRQPLLDTERERERERATTAESVISTLQRPPSPLTGPLPRGTTWVGHMHIHIYTYIYVYIIIHVYDIMRENLFGIV